MTKYSFNVKIPDEGQLTREQGWAALDRLLTKMNIVLSRMDANYSYDEEKSVLPVDEYNEAINVRNRFSRLVKLLGLDVLDKLASLNGEKEEDDLYGVNKFPPTLRWMLRNPGSDVRRFDMEHNGNLTVLAFALLEQADWEPAQIGEMIEKHLHPNSYYSEWFTCPCCDDHELGYIDKEPCAYCYEWGYVYGDKPNYSEFPESTKGRLAVSKGKEWTDEQEREALAEERDED